MSSVNEIHGGNFSSEINSNSPELIVEDEGQFDRKNSNNKFIDAAKKFNPMNLFNNNKVQFKTVSCGIEETTNEEDYKIAISQNGKFAVTFDSGKKKIKLISF
jgi:hypothetical protein